MATRPTRGAPVAALRGVDLVMRHSSRARRITLRVSTLDGRVTLTSPRGTDPARAIAFAVERAEWIRSVLQARPSPIRMEVGATLPIDGVGRAVIAGRRAGLSEDAVVIRDGRPVGPQVEAVVKAQARHSLAAAVARHAARLDRRAGRITLRDTRSRWGSCSSAGDLMFSWRLALAPPAVLDYVAAHEVAHLVRMDHSPAFWAVVEDLSPSYRRHRGWLRENGATLHAWRFRD